MKEQISVDEKLCCLCNDILDEFEIMAFKEYCQICVDLSCQIVPNVEMHKLKRMDENVKFKIEVFKHKCATAATSQSTGISAHELEMMRQFLEHLESLDK